MLITSVLVRVSALIYVSTQLESLHHQHDIHFILLAVRGNSASYAQPHIVTSTQAEQFWNVAMNQSIHAWTTRFEAYCVGGLHGKL